jgi:hypothetical protein
MNCDIISCSKINGILLSCRHKEENQGQSRDQPHTEMTPLKQLGW